MNVQAGTRDLLRHRWQLQAQGKLDQTPSIWLTSWHFQFLKSAFGLLLLWQRWHARNRATAAARQTCVLGLSGARPQS